MDSKTLVTPSRVFFAAVFFTQFVDDLYEMRAIAVPDSFDVMSRFAIVWVIWWWLRDDSRRLGVTWVLDLGMFLFIAWPLILPWHLFKTRGMKGFIPILAFILTILCAAVAAIVVAALLG